jgi:polyisoprenoid-binding protein YceI
MTAQWDFDHTHAAVGFAVRHLMVSKVRGAFTRWSGTLAFDEGYPESAEVDITIDAASVDTHVALRDEHLRSPDFFDVARFPTLRFRSTAVARTGDGRFTVTGDLTIRDVTRPVVLDVEYGGVMTDPWGGTRAGFSATTSIDRRDFGLTWNMILEAGGLTVGDTVEIALEFEAVKRKVALEAPVAA